MAALPKAGKLKMVRDAIALLPESICTLKASLGMLSRPYTGPMRTDAVDVACVEIDWSRELAELETLPPLRACMQLLVD